VRAAAVGDDREQRLVREFFRGVRGGFFVEVGANDPFQLSQTWHLEKLGWTGVLIEPQPELAAKLVSAREAMVFAVACSTPQNAGRTMPLHVAGPLSSLVRDRMAAGARPERTIEVPVRTLDDILVRASAPSPFELLSVDVEGHEPEVLQGFDFVRWRPQLIIVEDHVEDLTTHWFLQSNGYRLLRRVGFNGWYVPNDSTARANLRDRWEILRKYYLALPFRMMRNFSRRIRGWMRAR
jgi:FkbM family methyltransferase